MPCCCFQFCEGKKEKRKNRPSELSVLASFLIFADIVFWQTWIEFPIFACTLFLRNLRFAKEKKNPPECLWRIIHTHPASQYCKKSCMRFYRTISWKKESHSWFYSLHNWSSSAAADAAVMKMMMLLLGHLLEPVDLLHLLFLGTKWWIFYCRWWNGCRQAKDVIKKLKKRITNKNATIQILALTVSDDWAFQCKTVAFLGWKWGLYAELETVTLIVCCLWGIVSCGFQFACI